MPRQRLRSTTRHHYAGQFLIWLGLGTSVAAVAGAQGSDGDSRSATDVTSTEIAKVYEALGDGVDLQAKVVDIGRETNVAVGTLQRGAMKTEPGGPVRGIVHHDVTEIYYVLEGSGILMTGGQVQAGREWPEDSSAVTELVGPSMSASTSTGESRTIAAGDIVVIPAGVFHGFQEITSSIRYLSIRVDPEQVLPAGYLHPSIR
ncbi:MAG: cupin domain-containing protein [Acidobacteriota bacterium]|nr:cupin domain-containing protein [Acidobacteriota bacterium]